MGFLTEKCLADFKKYLWNEVYTKNEGHKWNMSFKEFPLLMQWGVYKKFFEGGGFLIDIVSYSDDNDKLEFYWCHINDTFVFDEKNNTEEFKTMESAMEAGIKRANELYNEK